MELNEIIAKNLIAYRKQMQLTQAELAEKINYSDKSISKWERGEGVPDIIILKQLADFYGITVNDFLNESDKIKSIKRKSAGFNKRIVIMLLSVGIAWLVATLVFICLNIFPNSIKDMSWLAFIYATVISAIILTIFSGIWHYKILNFFSISAIFWTVTLSLYLSVSIYNGWLLFLIPAALQVLLILWFFLQNEIKNKFFRKNKKVENKKVPKEIKKEKNSIFIVKDNKNEQIMEENNNIIKQEEVKE